MALQGLAAILLSALLLVSLSAQERSEGVAACAAWPKLDSTFPELDPSRTVRDPASGVVFYRTDLLLRFQAGTERAAKCALFKENGLTVIGETFTGGFFVRMPDPVTWERFDAQVASLRSDPSIYVVLRLDTASPAMITNAQ